MLDFKDTSELKVSKKIAEQIIGQDQGLQLIKKAAQHRRHVLLIGHPGTGKSLLGQALAELLPTQNELQDILCYPNEKDPNNPIIKTFPAEEGEKTIVKLRNSFENSISSRRSYLLIMGCYGSVNVQKSCTVLPISYPFIISVLLMDKNSFSVI